MVSGVAYGPGREEEKQALANAFDSAVWWSRPALTAVTPGVFKAQAHDLSDD